MRTLLVVAILCVLVLPSCSGKQKKTYEMPEGSPCPEWYLNVPDDPDYFYAAATATSKDLQMAVNKAKTEARAEIASEIELHLEGLTTKLDEEVGLAPDSNVYSKFTDAKKKVIDQTLRGTKVRYQHTSQEGSAWRACVLVECSRLEADEELTDRITKDEEMYTRFRDSEAFKELEKEIEKYRQYKKEHGRY